MPNLYLAFERQEVVVHTPRHARSLAELNESELAPVVTAWLARREAARGEGFGYVQLLLNEGREAGASVPHSHSQLVWLRAAPPAVVEERPNLERDRCALCDLLRDDTLEVALEGDLLLRAAAAGRAPYELLIAPREHLAHPGEESLKDALALLREGIRRLRELEGPVALNAWLHEGAHWHFEVVPRLTVFAGLELGAGLFVNWLAPEEAAKRLRESTPPSRPSIR